MTGREETITEDYNFDSVPIKRVANNLMLSN